MADEFYQFVDVGRFGNEAIGAEFVGALNIQRVTGRSKHDDSDDSQRRLGADPLEHLQARLDGSFRSSKTREGSGQAFRSA